jgi:hypothetical protein
VVVEQAQRTADGVTLEALPAIAAALPASATEVGTGQP